MRTLLIAIVGLVMGLPGVAQAEVIIDWVAVGDPGNAADTTGYGAVADAYQISKHETSNAQYVEFLNAVAATDTNSLYNGAMDSDPRGGITQTGVSGSFAYSVKTGFADKPVNFVSFYDALRFANWLHNGQPTGAQDNSTTEDGAYTITAEGIANNSITRNTDATFFLTSEDEWYKAAYYDGAGSYFDYPAGSNDATSCTVPGASPNTANCEFALQTPSDVGMYTASASPYGSFDQGGNVYEWNETVGLVPTGRGRRGGSFNGASSLLAASNRVDGDPEGEAYSVGFRLASPASAPPVPSLSPVGMVLLGSLLALTAWRRQAP